MARARSNTWQWIVIVVLVAALAVTVTLLVTGRDAPPPPPMSGPTAPPPSAPTSAAPTAPAQPKPSPLPGDPKEAAARERLLVISRALDVHFQRAWDFPDRLEVLIASGALSPADLADPWGRAVDYTRVAKARFKLCSRGADATSTTDDDVCIGPGGRTERAGRP